MQEVWLHTKEFDGETLRLIDSLSCWVLIVTDISRRRDLLSVKIIYSWIFCEWFIARDNFISQPNGSLICHLFCSQVYHYFFFVDKHLFLSQQQFFLANHLFWSLKNLGKCLKFIVPLWLESFWNSISLILGDTALTANYGSGMERDRKDIFWITTQIWATSECTQIASKYVGWAE